jgi:uncharacterized protein YuzE
MIRIDDPRVHLEVKMIDDRSFWEVDHHNQVLGVCCMNNKPILLVEYQRALRKSVLQARSVWIDIGVKFG